MMKRSIRAVAGICLALGFVKANAQIPVYHANLLGLSDGRINIQVEIPTGLNRWGQVIGTYGGGGSGGTHAVLWTPNIANDGFSAGSLFAIESSPGLPSGTADTGPTGLNDRGQVAGWAFTPGQGDGNQRQSWMWRPTTLNSPTGTLHGNAGSAVTFPLLSIQGQGTGSEGNQSINNKGAIAASGFAYRALLFTPTAPNSKCGTWTYDPNHAAPTSGINDAGQIVGTSCESAVWNGPYLHSGAFPPLLDSDVLTSPLWIPPSSQECVGYGTYINSKGDLAVAAASTAGGIRAFLYKAGVAKDVSRGLGSHVSGINFYDQIVGSADTDTRRAYLFQNGTALDLNTLNDSTGGLLLKQAIAINNAGQILATGVYPGGTGASILLTPNALVSNPVLVTKGPIQINGTTYSQTVTVQNNGTTTIAGPISVALDGLTAGVILTNKTGKTAYTGPGSVYANVSSSDLAAGATTAAFTLVFSNPQLKTINYTARVLGTSAPR
jgi:hypothetical protein